MTFVVVLAAGVAAVALGHLIIGWVLANGLHKSALRVGGRPPEEPGVWVRSFDGQTVTLAAKEPRQDIGHPGRTTLVYPDGRVIVGDVTAASRLEITRSVLQSTGEPPPLCVGPLDTCQPVVLNPYVYLDDPGELGLEYEEVSYSSELGDHPAWIVPGADPESWVVMVHGWTAHRQELLRMLPVFHQAGFNALVIDYRNDEGSPRDPSGLHRFSLTEWKDLEAASQLTVERGAKRLVLAGCSTGAALVMGLLENSELADAVNAVVLDSPNVVLSEAIRHGTRHVKATRLMIEFGMWIADLRWGVDWETTNYVQRADQILRQPALVFHGTSDHRVPIAVSRRLQSQVPDLVDLVEFPAAGHVMSWNADPERYEQHLEAFLRRV